MNTDFDSDQRILSPARRARRSILALTTIMLLVVGPGAAKHWAQDNVFLTSGPDGEWKLYYHPPFSKPGTLVAVFGATPDNLTRASSTWTTQASIRVIETTFEPATSTQVRQPGDSRPAAYHLR
ncbi:MAG: hypothetical protein IPN98_15905 [Propionivibrio sp.]|nr:hypothetical protein [Propionivibrio sp.]